MADRRKAHAWKFEAPHGGGDSRQKARVLALLRRAVNDPRARFRDGQWEAIDAVANRQQRLLVVERTGWGKSMVYFIATRLLRDRRRGPTLIVSPLLALMRNQIAAARRIGIEAVSINSTNTSEWPELKRRIRSGRADALLISPERLGNDDFVQNVLLHIGSSIGLLVVDEAHCISDWGHDFRPDYRRLVRILRLLPKNMPVLCTTATANDRVIRDVKKQLGNILIQRGSLMRKTLALQTMRLPSQAARLAWLAEHVKDLPGTGIVYTLTKRDARQVADWLNARGVESHAYFSGVEHDDFETTSDYRHHLEDRLLNNELKVLVATTALGMGYDKPDLGFVIHYQAPGSIVSYYQQVGRAGRNIDRAIGLMMTGKEDENIHDYFRRSAFPSEKWVDRILGELAGVDGASVRTLESALNLRYGQIGQVLKFLSADDPAPVIKDRYQWRRTAVRYRMDQEKIDRLTKQRESEWGEVQRYIDEQGCLMQFLAAALDDLHPEPCGKCASCVGAPIVDTSYSDRVAAEAALFIRQADLPLVCKKQSVRDAFPEYGFKVRLPAELRAETGRILSRWGDAGYGHMVADDKHRGRFRDELVEAVAEMVRVRWKPEPRPAWITCVPSLKHMELVPDFAKRLACALGLPFRPVVVKVKDNEPQKLQENRFHQCRNLDGVFAVRGRVPSGPVLLIDDVVDSVWTLTVVAALLRQSGCGPVFPVALTTSGQGG